MLQGSFQGSSIARQDPIPRAHASVCPHPPGASEQTPRAAAPSRSGAPLVSASRVAQTAQECGAVGRACAARQSSPSESSQTE